MKHPTFEFPEAKGRTVEHIAIYDDGQNGREVLLRFTDETVLSVVLQTSIEVRGTLYSNQRGMMEEICVRGDGQPKEVLAVR